MTIALVIAILVMAGCIATLTFKIIKVEQKAESTMAETKATAVSEKLNSTIATYNQNFSVANERMNKADEEIETIIKRMEGVAVRIGKLENDMTVVKRDEKEIRRYYVNYRTPDALPKYSAGVPWASEFKCVDDMSTEEKIKILRDEADAYKAQLNTDLSSSDRRMILNSYANCLKELRDYEEKENE